MQIRNALAACGLAALSACGGGGGGGGDGSSPDSPSVSLQVTSLTMTAVQKNFATGTFNVSTLGFKPGEVVYFGLEGDDDDLLSNFDAGGGFDDVANMSVTLRNDLVAGVRTETLKLHACVDENCKTEYRGSPMQLAFTADVTPNLGVAELTTLQRTGADAAPSADIPVAVPAAAGALYFSPGNSVQGLVLTYADHAVHVETAMLRAGTYTATARLQGIANAAYFADLTVQYIVNPPVGGEHAMSVVPQTVRFSLNQGDTKVQRITVTRPTWTSDYTPLALSSGCDSVYSLADLGAGTYELTASAVGQPADIILHACSLDAYAGDTGVQVSATAQIGQAFGVGALQSFTIARDTVASALQQSVAVTMSDGSAATWRASTTSPWLQLARTTGTTGVDALGVVLDTGNLAAYLPMSEAHVLVSVDRPNVPVQDIALALGFATSWLSDAWPGTFADGAGRLYIAGQFEPDIVNNHAVSISGARMTHLQAVTDPFFVGNVQVLQVDVDHTVDGQPIAVAIGSPLLTTQASVPVAMGRSFAAGFATLPYALRKPPSFSAVNGALYFAGQDTVWRYAGGAGAWALTSAALPGVIDVDPRPDQAHLLAVSANSVALLDPTTLRAAWSGVPVSDYFGAPAAVVGATEPDSKSVLHTTDGNAWVTYGTPSATDPTSGGVGQLTLGWFDAAAPSDAHINQSRGALAWPVPGGAPPTPWMIASADRQAVLATSANASDATALRGESMTRLDVDAPFGTAGGGLSGEAGFSWPVAPAAVSADGFPALRTDGELWYASSGGMHSADLRGLVPAGQVAGGWGITRDGALILLYTYRLDGGGATATASQPILHVFQLKSDVTAVPTVPPPEVATIALGGVPGCGSPRAAGEACEHTAHVLPDPTSSVVFVLGPRGVAAVPLPPSVTALTRASAASRSKAAAARDVRAAQRAVKRP